ncbi:MAG: thiolase C-terminal domain-containing protein [Dehalococcoidia bacterium]
MTWAGKGKVAVAGVGFSELRRSPGKSLGRLAFDAAHAALADAGLEAAAIDGIATYPDPPFYGAGRRDGIDLVSVEYFLKHFPLAPEVRWYAQVDQGLIASAVIEAANAIIAGMADYVLVWRAMHSPTGTYTRVVTNQAAGDAQFSLPYGQAAIYQWHAMAYQRYLHLYGATREAMATLAVNQRRNANRNENAYFRDTPLTAEDYLNARFIAEPICLFDCDIPVEGCAAFVLTSAERARDLRNPPAYIAAMAQNTSGRPALISYILDDYMACGGTLAGQLWKDAGLGPRDMQAAQLYDGFSPSVYYWLEAAGFCGLGEAHSFIQDGRIALEGELPVNTFGGSLSEGRLHGMGHLAEAVRQVSGRAGPRQVPGAAAVCAIDGSPLLRGSGIIFTAEP